MKWRELTRVCRHWRAVALETPGFWLEIDITRGLGFLQLCLQRSQNALVTIIASNRESRPRRIRRIPDASNIMAVITSHAHRIRSLRFSPVSCHFMAVYLSLLRTEMPALKTLALTPSDVCLPDWESSFEPLSNQFPNMQSLILEGTNVPWGALALRNLVHLELRRVKFRSPPSANAMFTLLKESPSLEYLTLEWSWPKSTRADPVMHASENSDHTITLPHLWKLRLADQYEVVSSFLSRVTIPIDASVELFCDNYTLGEDRRSWNIIPALLPRKKDELRDIDRLTIELGRGILTFKAYTSQSPDGRGSPWLQCTVEFDIPPVLSHGEIFCAMLRFAVDIFERCSVTSLDIIGDQSCFTEDDWDKVFLVFPRLKFLTVTATNTVQALFDALQMYHPDDHTRLTAPDLEVLSIVGDAEGEDIADCLLFRPSHGSRLKLFNLENPCEDDVVGERRKY
ncbi:uncharacterized protein LAESUDRAFT_722056 [Laetiporus sulphureus 93-53]|uniref:F-box domain-containing protein n=1 Tax=Laetiporus sulphureus 93-53 TaxID=1314785 RepID=A0A165G6R9_9APHY|nr:uncharacterized protein LAESUDRAFT_722056 [Laetiporus sulphureus 93-53]KZT09904.1 hypothetical protein LAESUDRAFT_722056 [Laetiporus sulphureus 93-53]